VPELPEVETIRRQLEPELTGRTIARARILDERWTRPVPPQRIERRLARRRIESVRRRGKYLLLGLDGGDVLAIHLRMTGNLILGQSDGRWLRAVLELDDGRELRFTDPRRFGQAILLPAGRVDSYFEGRVGIEPLTDELTAEALCRVAAGRRAPLKSFLLNQAGIAGVGNIYADEALWRARLHPLSPAGSMRLEHCKELREGIVAALDRGLAEGGASMDDYLDARGERGSMQDEFLVHTRAGEPCLRCGETIRRIVVGGRSTYFCPGCQRRLRRRRRKPSRPASRAT
jgi:formamidopyrimidine-DNA glycosylase